MIAKAFIDTNIYIYALTESQDQKDESKRVIALSVFEALIQSQTVVTSTQVLNEFHSNLVKKFKLDDVAVFNIIQQNILPISLIAPIGFQTYQLSFVLKATYGEMRAWSPSFESSLPDPQNGYSPRKDLQNTRIKTRIFI